MNRKGVSYDVGRVMGINWRPIFDTKIVHRELEIIKNDLHCNAVRICGLNIDRLMIAAEDALKQGLEVWLSPELWEKNPKKTLQVHNKGGYSSRVIASAMARSNSVQRRFRVYSFHAGYNRRETAHGSTTQSQKLGARQSWRAQ